MANAVFALTLVKTTPKENQLVEIRTTHEAPDDLVEECGHPKHAPLHLVVTPMSGCDGFEPARA